VKDISYSRNSLDGVKEVKRRRDVNQRGRCGQERSDER